MEKQVGNTVNNVSNKSITTNEISEEIFALLNDYFCGKFYILKNQIIMEFSNDQTFFLSIEEVKHKA